MRIGIIEGIEQNRQLIQCVNIETPYPFADPRTLILVSGYVAPGPPVLSTSITMTIC